MVVSGRRHRVLVTALVGALLGGVAGCVPDFAPASELGERPQMLAIRATPPETTPGGAAVFDALLHEPAGPLHLAWIACYGDPRGWSETCVADALAAGETLAPCDGVSAARVCVASTDATAVVPVPPWVTPVIADEDGVPVEAVVHVQLVASVVPDPLAACGEALAAVRPSEACLLGTKQILVSDRPEPTRNQNPAVASLAADGVACSPGEAMALAPGGVALSDYRVTLNLSLDPATVDEAVDAQGNPDEAFLELRWFTDCGSFTEDTRRLRCDPVPGAPAGAPPTCEAEETRWRPKASGPCTVHAVVSDGRGGISSWSQPFLVGP